MALIEIRNRFEGVVSPGGGSMVASMVSSGANLDGHPLGMAENKQSPIVPNVDYVWSLVDEQGNVFWSRTTTGKFAFRGSKLFVGTDGGKERYESGSTPLPLAMALDIIEQDHGFMVPIDIPKEFFSGGGSQGRFQMLLNWNGEPHR